LLIFAANDGVSRDGGCSFCLRPVCVAVQQVWSRGLQPVLCLGGARNFRNGLCARSFAQRQRSQSLIQQCSSASALQRKVF
jgi:hypothetical protein